jgi:hypothetical protein
MFTFEAATVSWLEIHRGILNFVVFMPSIKAIVSCNLVSCCLKIIAGNKVFISAPAVVFIVLELIRNQDTRSFLK